VSEEVAQTLQAEMHRRMSSAGHHQHQFLRLPLPPLRPLPSGALLAIKPSSGVKRNNAKASDGPFSNLNRWKIEKYLVTE
jgi:hypothetical protein